MGLLDDAIREHLDLKRRRGADPAEVEREEREALGPVRRGPEEPVAMTPADEPPPAYDEPPPAYDEADDAAWDDLAHDAAHATERPGLVFEGEEEYFDDDEYPEPSPGSAAAHPAPPDHDEPPFPDRPPAVAGGEAHPEPDLGPRSAPGALEFTQEHDAGLGADRPPLPHQAPAGAHDEFDEPPRRSAAEVAGETTEYDVERHLAREEGGSEPDEDVLEETPEFLQDTPDHDRLWFEQRPPKDFDFDG